MLFRSENCGELIPHSKKRWMVERGEWRATAESQMPGLVSFHLWAAYSYSPAADWSVLVREYQEALEAMRRGDPDAMQTFHNTVLGTPWEDTIAEFVWGFLFDAIHHRGQLSAYLRAMGGKVPGIYGPSGDTQ